MRKIIKSSLILILAFGYNAFGAKAIDGVEKISGLYQLKQNQNATEQQFHSVYYNNDFAVYFGNQSIHYVSNSIQGENAFINRLDVDYLNVSENVKINQINPSNLSAKIRRSVNGNMVELNSIDSIEYKGIYDNIDLVYFINQEGKLTYNYKVGKNASLTDIQVAYGDEFQTELDETGNLKMMSPSGYFSESAPITYAVSNERTVQSSFQLSSDNVLSFNIDNFSSENEEEYVIDPSISFTTYFGGAGSDLASDMAIDDSSNIYITGTTRSNNFPITAGAFQTTKDIAQDAVVFKFDSIGNLKWSTFYGGEDQDEGSAIAVSESGKVFVTGLTRSLTLPGTFNTQPGNGSSYVLALNNDGSFINARYLGGNSDDEGRGIITIGDTVFVTGLTGSINFPLAGIGLTTVKNTGDDVFLTALNDTTGIIWSQYYGGSSGDRALSITKDTLNNLIIAGETESIDLPMLLASQATKQGLDDGFLAKFNSLGLRLWSTYYGGDNLDRINSVTVGDSNEIYVVGSTASSDLSFPTTGTTYQDTLGGGLLDAFILKLDDSGNPLWGSYYGGTESDEGKSIAVSDVGTLIITGETESDNFPLTENALQMMKGTQIDAFNVQFDTSGTRIYASFLGGNQNDFGRTVKYQKDFSSYYIVGNTRSTDFPAALNAFQATNEGDNDIFIIKSCGLIPNNKIAAAGLDTLLVCTNENIPQIIGSTPLGGSGNYTYQYQLLNTNTNTFVDIAGATAINYQPSIGELNVGFNTYRRIVSDGVCSDTTGITVIGLLEAPQSNFSFTTNCANGPIEFRDSSTAFGTDSVVFWLWNFGNGITTFDRNPDYVYGTSGTYQVSLLVRASKNRNNCFSVSTQTVTVLETPNAGFTFSSSCEDEVIQFTNTTTNVSDSIYAWDFGDGTTSTLENPTHVYDTAGTYQVQLIVGENTCRDTITQAIVVDTKPIANFSNSATTCSDSLISFTDLSTASGTITSWNWSFGDGNTSSLQNPMNTYTSSGVFSVRLIVVSNSGCNDTLIRSLNIGLPPSVDFTSAAECIDQEASFTDQSVSSIGSVNSWNWNFGDGNTSTEQNPTNVYAATGTYTVALGVTTTEGCIDSTNKTITVDTKPTVEAGNDVTVVKGESVRLNATSNFSGSYSWTPLNGISPSSVADPTANPFETTVYTVQLTDANGCFNTDSLTVTVLPEFFIPSAFTPNNDGDNDGFEVVGIERFSGHSVSIFNRWGALLYEARDNYQTKEWDGTYEGEELPMGTYYYVIDLNNDNDAFKGTITILR